MIEKAVPVVLRSVSGRLEILMFRHPQAGLQLVKGTVEPGERPDSAALRELFEESGIGDGEIVGPLGCTAPISPDERWHFYRCRADGLRERWSHRTTDGGGLEFSFFWQPLEDVPEDRCDPAFIRALDFIRKAMSDSGNREFGP